MEKKSKNVYKRRKREKEEEEKVRREKINTMDEVIIKIGKY